MAKTHRHPAVSRTFVRNGEGALVDAVPSAVATPDGKTVVSVNINLANAPVPDRRYVSDIASVLYKRGDGAIKLVFGQEKISGSSFRSLLIIHMSTSAARHFISSLRTMSNPSLTEITERVGVKPEPLSTITDEPEQTVAFASNVVLAAVSGMDACLDFYQISSFSIAHAQVSRKVGADPVVRVDIRSALLLSLLHELSELESSFPPEQTESEQMERRSL